jgi:hypothetical protein
VALSKLTKFKKLETLLGSSYVDAVFMLHFVKCFQIELNAFHKLSYNYCGGNCSFLMMDIDIVS